MGDYEIWEDELEYQPWDDHNHPQSDFDDLMSMPRRNPRLRLAIAVAVVVAMIGLAVIPYFARGRRVAPPPTTTTLVAAEFFPLGEDAAVAQQLLRNSAGVPSNS